MWDKLATFAETRIPCLFFTDFEGKSLHCYSEEECRREEIAFTFNGTGAPHAITLQPEPVDFEIYASKLEQVKHHIRCGETYLLNLTQPSPIHTRADLETIYRAARAPFKLRFKDRFVCFSPEKFIEIDADVIRTYPMKGTIDAALPDAASRILADSKEMAEHLMVVDLLRNDLGMVADRVRVERFRYVAPIRAGNRTLLQVSSEISAALAPNWQDRLPELLRALLPAGSISGTPKRRTVSIIKAVEGYERGFFTGVFGWFDGHSLRSAVMIRFIESSSGGLIYKSGGGITIDSDPRREYEEMVQKIYVP